MGLLNSVLGALLGPEGIEGQEGGLQAVVAMLAEDGEQGGLAGLVQRLQGGGLGEVVSSWIGTGANLGVSAEQLQAVLGGDWIERFAQQLGQHPGEAVQTLAQLLPQVVDRLTPDGRLPDVGSSGFGDLGSVLERFSKP
jgi:uncharacterized protein YidB (DUF937 family)